MVKYTVNIEDYGELLVHDTFDKDGEDTDKLEEIKAITVPLPDGTWFACTVFEGELKLVN